MNTTPRTRPRAGGPLAAVAAVALSAALPLALPATA
ncbi:hypothetical protein GA0115242_11934, partial [Streptomyces sp. SolWspMP-5a-2]